MGRGMFQGAGPRAAGQGEADLLAQHRGGSPLLARAGSAAPSVLWGAFPGEEECWLGALFHLFHSFPDRRGPWRAHAGRPGH